MVRPSWRRAGAAAVLPLLALAGPGPVAELLPDAFASEEAGCSGGACPDDGAVRFVQQRARRLQGAVASGASSGQDAAADGREQADPEIMEPWLVRKKKRAFQRHFAAVVSDEAARACRIGSISGCPCADGTNGTYCCMDGDLLHGGSSGGRPVPGTAWRWLRREGTAWRCTEENDCPESEATEHQRGAEPPFETADRGADILHAPSSATCDTPRVLYVHGGGWSSGAPNEMGYFTTGSRLARDAGAVVMAIDYPLARTCYKQARGSCPDAERANFEVILSWTVEALEHLLREVPHIPGTRIPAEGCSNIAPVIIGGDSSGGGTALSALLSVAPNGPVSLLGRKHQLAGAFLWSGFYDLQCTSPSYVETSYSGIPRFGRSDYGDASAWWHVGATDAASDAASRASGYYTPSGYAYDNCRVYAVDYAGSDADTENPYASTTKAKPGMLQGLPPMILSVDGSYGLVGEAHVVAQNAAWADSNNEVYLDVYPGLVHDFQMYSEGCGSGAPLWQGEMAWKRTAAFIRSVAGSKAAPPHVPHAPCHTRMPRGNPLTTYHIAKPQQHAGGAGQKWGANSAGDFAPGC